MEGEFTHSTLDAIAQLRAKFSNPAFDRDLDEMRENERKVRDLIAREELASNEKLREIIKGYLEDVTKWEDNLRVMDSETLPDKARDRLLDKIVLYKNFAALFDIAKINEEIQGVDKWVRDELAALH